MHEVQRQPTEERWGKSPSGTAQMQPFKAEISADLDMQGSKGQLRPVRTLSSDTTALRRGEWAVQVLIKLSLDR